MTSKWRITRIPNYGKSSLDWAWMLYGIPESKTLRLFSSFTSALDFAVQTKPSEENS